VGLLRPYVTSFSLCVVCLYLFLKEVNVSSPKLRKEVSSFYKGECLPNSFGAGEHGS
jgi:hypothetical protein